MDRSQCNVEEQHGVFEKASEHTQWQLESIGIFEHNKNMRTGVRYTHMEHQGTPKHVGGEIWHGRLGEWMKHTRFPNRPLPQRAHQTYEPNALAQDAGPARVSNTRTQHIHPASGHNTPSRYEPNKRTQHSIQSVTPTQGPNARKKHTSPTHGPNV